MAEQVYIDYTVTKDTLESDVLTLYEKLFSSVQDEDVVVEELRGGVINAMFKVSRKTDDDGKYTVIFRMHGFKMDPTKFVEEMSSLAKSGDNEVAQDNVEAAVSEKENVQLNGETDTQENVNDLDKVNDEDKVHDNIANVECTEKKSEKKNAFVRADECLIMNMLNPLGVSAKCFGKFNNGICYEYLEGTTLDADLMQVPDVEEQLPIRIAQFQHIEYPDRRVINGKTDTRFEFFKREFEPSMAFLNQLIQADIDKSENEYAKQYPSMFTLNDETQAIRQQIIDYGLGPIAYCHNDLNLHNWIYNDKKKQLYLIDFEWADYNYVAYDLAVAFAGYAGYFLDEFMPERLPDEEKQKKLIKCYLEERNRLGDLKEEINDELIHTYYVRVNLHMLMFFLQICMFATFWQFKPDMFKPPEDRDDPDYILKFGLASYQAYVDLKDKVLALVAKPATE